MKQYYDSTKSKFASRLVALKRRSSLMVLGKVAAFIAFGTSLYFFITDNNIVWGVATTISAIAYLALLKFDKHACEAIDLLERQITVCSNELCALHGDFHAFDNGNRYSDTDHPYAGDIDIFGPESLYQRMCRTATACGATRLADMLCNTLHTSCEIQNRQKALDELSDTFADMRIHWMAMPPIDKIPDITTISTTGSSTDYSPAIIAISVITIISVISGFVFQIPVLLAISLLGFGLQLAIVSSRNKAVNNAMRRTDTIMSDSSRYTDMLSLLHELEFKSAYLRQRHISLFSTEADSLRSFRQLAQYGGMFAIRANPVFWMLLNGLCSFDLLIAYKVNRWITDNAPHVTRWIDDIAEFDALISLATYNFNYPKRCRPIAIDNISHEIIKAKALYHPFIDCATAVANDFTIDQGTTYIITGANMAGKSTFLRSMAINLVLAQNGCRACADEFYFLPATNLFTSINIKDNLVKSKSYFKMELERVDRLLKFTTAHTPCLAIVDEVFRGTNSRDKLAGSRMLMQELSRRRASVLVATHDIDLCQLADESPRFENYCFELTPAMDCTYRIQPGICSRHNALALLESLINENRILTDHTL